MGAEVNMIANLYGLSGYPCREFSAHDFYTNFCRHCWWTEVAHISPQADEETSQRETAQKG